MYTLLMVVSLVESLMSMGTVLWMVRKSLHRKL